MEIKNIDLSKIQPKIRHLDDMREVLCDQEWSKTAPNADLYYMFGDLVEDGNLKYSITIVAPKLLGKEFNKTKGHVHIGNYQETYTVLGGEAIYLMQKGDENKIEDVYAVFAKEGESIIIPAGYGHITINIGKTDLKTGDWRNINCKQDYSLFEKLHGGCFYYTTQGWIKNENYKNVPELRFEEPLKELKDLDFLK
jgi:glucose-6-phosphate isomerase